MSRVSKERSRPMKRITMFLLLSGMIVTNCAAQNASTNTDVLGAHLNYGRGCAACHTPHSGAMGNGFGTSAPTPSQGSSVALWGEDASRLYGKTITTDGGKYTEVLPSSMSATTPDVAGILACLSCHDGNLGSNTMMQNRVYETLPPTYGKQAIPTLLGGTGSTSNYLNDHPVGLNVTVNCGSGMGWDCSLENGVLQMSGVNSRKFVKNYGLFVKFGVYNNTAVVLCTTCHDQHSMNVVVVDGQTQSGLPTGEYTTMFFLRGPYNPANMSATNNQTAQFCRQCHANLSNEMRGSSAGTSL